MIFIDFIGFRCIFDGAKIGELFGIVITLMEIRLLRIL